MDNSMTPTKNDISKKADTFANKGDTLAQKAKHLGEDILDSDFGSQVTEKWGQIRDRSEDVYNSSVEVVRRHPLATVSTALAVGVLAGMILKRRH